MSGRGTVDLGPGEAPPVAAEMLKARQVAAWLQVSEPWVYAHAEPDGPRPHLPALRTGGVVRFRRADIERFIEEWMVGAPRP